MADAVSSGTNTGLTVALETTGSSPYGTHTRMLESSTPSLRRSVGRASRAEVHLSPAQIAMRFKALLTLSALLCFAQHFSSFCRGNLHLTLLANVLMRPCDQWDPMQIMDDTSGQRGEAYRYRAFYSSGCFLSMPEIYSVLL